MISIWIQSFRLRTLPLAVSSVFMGSFLAKNHNVFAWPIFCLAVLTTVLLQILSNIANDYGDFIHGADTISTRKGPKRAVSSGQISPKAMKKAIGIFILACLISGISLIYISLKSNIFTLLLFFLLGICCIAAAVFYTMGKYPYGYRGFGDVAVLVFFGFVAVVGTYFLYAQTVSIELIFPAAACGFFSVGVLNVNNIRDLESDRLAGKNSLPVRLGPAKARIYHILLLAAGFSCALAHSFIYFKSGYQFLYLCALPLFIFNGYSVFKRNESAAIDPLLKQLALSTLIFVILFGIGLLVFPAL